MSPIVLALALALAVGQAAAEGPTDRPPPPEIVPVTLFDAINGLRVRHGLRPLDPDPALDAAAKENNARQVARGMGHYHNPGTWQVVAYAGDPRQAVSLWMRSPSHRLIVLAPWARRMGSHWEAPYATVNIGR